MTTSSDAGVPPEAPVRYQGRRRWLTVLLCSVIFLAGGVVGGGLTGLVLVRRAQDAINHPEQMPGRIAKRLAHRLDLDPEQAQQVVRILEHHQASLLGVRAAMWQRAEPELDRLEVDVAGILRPDQVERWRRHYRTLRDDWRPRFPNRPPRADGSPREGPSRERD
jgi:hypothetical protein